MVPVSTDGTAYMTFEGRLSVTYRYLLTDQLNLCLKPGNTERLMVDTWAGEGPDRRQTGVYAARLTNYTLHLRPSCKADETDASTASTSGLGH